MTKPAYTYDELDEIFRGNGHNDIVGMSLIDGLIAALVAGPVFVDPREWLPLIFGGRLPAGEAGTPEHLAINTILNRYNEVSAILGPRLIKSTIRRRRRGISRRGSFWPACRSVLRYDGSP